MRCRYRENKIYCGDYLEVNIYPVYKKPGARGKRNKPSTEVQKKLNEHHSANKLIRLLHTNFTCKDLELHLTYDDDFLPTDDIQAKKDVQNFLRRAKRLYHKNGITEFKYISVTEQGSKKGRIHHHITLCGGIDRDQLEKLWGKGYANTKRLQFNKNGLVGLGHYIVKQPLFSKRWNASKNLKKPIERPSDSRITKTKAIELSTETENRIPFEALYPDYFFSECEYNPNEINNGIYLTIRMYKKEAVLM